MSPSHGTQMHNLLVSGCPSRVLPDLPASRCVFLFNKVMRFIANFVHLLLASWSATPHALRCTIQRTPLTLQLCVAIYFRKARWHIGAMYRQKSWIIIADIHRRLSSSTSLDIRLTARHVVGPTSIEHYLSIGIPQNTTRYAPRRRPAADSALGARGGEAAHTPKHR